MSLAGSGMDTWEKKRRASKELARGRGETDVNGKQEIPISSSLVSKDGKSSRWQATFC